MSLPAAFRSTLRLPTIAAPMFLVSGPELVIGTCGPGAPVCVTVGAFVGGALAAFGVSFVW
ncbi:hypothetical protein [Denitromonas sp.]|uniref:hypothetical protein n=1 Tax=Denitromonas sp. TaxID=2734609 RepID=UPI002AFFF628|nr:hypothetical protein [Denitromonas sp.]